MSICRVDPKNNLDWNYLTEYKEIHGNFKEVATGVYPDINFNNYAYFDNNDRNFFYKYHS